MDLPAAGERAPLAVRMGFVLALGVVVAAGERESADEQIAVGERERAS